MKEWHHKGTYCWYHWLSKFWALKYAQLHMLDFSSFVTCQHPWVIIYIHCFICSALWKALPNLTVYQIHVDIMKYIQPYKHLPFNLNQLTRIRQTFKKVSRVSIMFITLMTIKNIIIAIQTYLIQSLQSMIFLSDSQYSNSFLPIN